MAHQEFINGSNPTSAIGDDNRYDGQALSQLDFAHFVTTSKKNYIPPHGSKSRDYLLRCLVLNNDILSVVMGHFVTKLAALVPTVRPTDKEDEQQVLVAELSNMFLKSSWLKEIPKALFDLATYDGGMFIEILGGEDQDFNGPLEPTEILPGVWLPGLGLKVLDSLRCHRTGDSEFPVEYVGKNISKSVKLHHTRIIEHSFLPLSNVDSRGYGLSLVSRAIKSVMKNNDIVRLLGDLVSTGSTDKIVFHYGINPNQIEDSFALARERLDRQLDVSSNMHTDLFIHVRDPEFKIQEVMTRQLPPDHDEDKELQRVVSMVTSAFGLDSREVGFKIGLTGQTKADAEIQNKKTLDKIPSMWITLMQTELEHKFIAFEQEVSFEAKTLDDKLQEAEIRQIISENTEKELSSGVLNLRNALDLYLQCGYLTQDQYDERLETITNPTTQENIQSLFARERQLINKPFISLKQAPIETEDEYQAQFQEIVDRLKDGDLTDSQFEEVLDELVITGMISAYLIGSNKTVNDLSQTDLATIEVFIENHRDQDSIDNLIQTTKNDQDNINILWGLAFARMIESSKLFRSDDPLYRWEINPTAQNCDTCSGLNGRVRRRSAWLNDGLYPRVIGNRLSCGGWNCLCIFSEV